MCGGMCLGMEWAREGRVPSLSCGVPTPFPHLRHVILSRQPLAHVVHPVAVHGEVALQLDSILPLGLGVQHPENIPEGRGELGDRARMCIPWWEGELDAAPWGNRGMGWSGVGWGKS